jgi:hypothetical protein
LGELRSGNRIFAGVFDNKYRHEAETRAERADREIGDARRPARDPYLHEFQASRA